MKAKLIVMALLCTGLSSCKMTADGIDLGALSKVGSSLLQMGAIDQPKEIALGEDFAAMLCKRNANHTFQS